MAGEELVLSRPTLSCSCAGAGSGGPYPWGACTGAQGARGWRSTPPRRAIWPQWRTWTCGRAWPPSGARPAPHRRCTGLLASLMPWHTYPPPRCPPPCCEQGPSGSLSRCLPVADLHRRNGETLAWTNGVSRHPVDGAVESTMTVYR